MMQWQGIKQEAALILPRSCLERVRYMSVSLQVMMYRIGP